MGDISWYGGMSVVGPREVDRNRTQPAQCADYNLRGSQHFDVSTGLDDANVRRLAVI